MSVVLGLYITCMSLSLLTLVWGSRGYHQYQDLQAYKERLEDNVILLEKYHENLRWHAKRLASDKEAVILAARELGYYKSNEGRIVLANGSADTGHNYTVGTFVKPYKAEETNGMLLLFLSVVSGAAAAVICWSLIEEKRR